MCHRKPAQSALAARDRELLAQRFGLRDRQVREALHSPQAPGLNNYRQNVQPQGEFSAPDVTAAIFPICDNLPYALVARVRNIGQAAVPAGVVVGFYAGDPDMGGMLLGSGMTKKSLYPAEAEDVVLELAMPDPGLIDGSIPVFVVVDDGMPARLVSASL